MNNEIVEPSDSRLTAYAVGEMAPEEAKAFELELENSPEAREEVERIRETAELLREEFSAELDAAFAGREKAEESPLALVESGAVNSPGGERSFFPEMRIVIAALAAVLVGLAVVGVTWMKNAGNQKEIVVAAVDSTPKGLEEGHNANGVDATTESGVEVAFTGPAVDGVPPQAIATTNAVQPLKVSPAGTFYLTSAEADNLNLENRLYLGDDPILSDARTLGEDPISGRPMFVPQNEGVAIPAAAGLARRRGHAMAPRDMRYGYAIEGLDPAIPNPRNYVEVVGQISADGSGSETRSLYVVGKTTDRNGDPSVRIKGMVHGEEGAAAVAEKQSSAKPGGEVTVPEAAERYVGRLQERVQKAEEAALRGSELLADGDYQGSIAEMQAALDLMPDAPLTQNRKKAYAAQFAASSVELAKQRADEAEYQEARGLLESVLAPGVDPNHFAAKQLLERLDDPEYYSAALTPDHFRAANAVESAHKKASSYLAIGDIDRAEEEYWSVLNDDLYNTAARRSLEEIERHRMDYYKHSRNHTRAEFLNRVSEGWELPVPVATTTAPAPNNTGPAESFGGGGGGKLGNETAGGQPVAPGASASVSASGGNGGMVGSGSAGQLTAGLTQAEPPAKNRLKYARERIQNQELETKQLEQDLAEVRRKSQEFDLAIQGLSVPAGRPTASPQPTAADGKSPANDYSLDEASRRRVVLPGSNATPDATLAATMPVEVDAFAADQSLAGGHDASTPLNKAAVGLFLPPEEPGFVGRTVPPPAPSKPVSGRGKFARTFDNPFKDPMETALSTFSIDVDTASFTEIRRMILRDGQLPDRDQVRVEEFINYFNYDSYPAPDLAKLEEKEAAPFSVNLECAAAPWNPANRIVRIGLKGADIPAGERPAANLVFLLDVSGSMKSVDKLPLLQKSLRELIPQLREDDRITIVVYASKAGEVLDPTPGNDSKTILAAINALTAKGSTNGEGGIRIAYQRARENFIEDGVNRILLATDGDFNVGQDSDEELVSLIEKESKSGIELTVLGFGTGNLNDSMMEKITNKGNGQFHYIDRIEEGRRVLVEEMNSSLVTIAKDVKIQVEFNAGRVAAYRLIGYANRMMPREDFNDDTKDAGEIGAGHTVTALYEVVPVEALMQLTEVEPIDDLKYKKPAEDEDGKAMSLLEQRRLAMKKRGIDLVNSPELLTVKLRYKQPGADVSEKLELPLVDSKKEFAEASADFRFATAVGAFGEWLRIRPASGQWNPDGNARQGRSNHQLEKIAEIAHRSIEGDEYGRKKELVEMIKSAATLNGGSISLEGAADDLVDEKAPAKGDVGTSVKEKLKQLR